MSDDLPISPQMLAAALVDELAATIGSLLGTTPSVVPATAPASPSWRITVRVGEPTPCAVALGTSRADGVRLARLVGAQEDPPDAVVLESLKNLVGQALGSLRRRPLASNVLMLVDSPEAVIGAPGGEATGYAITASEDFTPIFGAWTQGDWSATASATPRAHNSDTPACTRQPRSPWDSACAVPANLDVVLDIDLPLSVRFGQTDLTLDALTRLGPGSLIDLGRSPEEPVDVLVNGRLVARAEVVVVNGNYGVRVLEVVSTADRVRSLGA